MSLSENSQPSSPADVRVGTSGYSFDDWRGRFYPDKTIKGKMLDYYVQHFRTVEINSTYYRIPHPAIMANITKKAPDGFDFMVKVPQSFTHRRSDLESDLAKYLEALKPMLESGKLAGLLAQFPYSFKFSPDGLDYLSSLHEALQEFALFIEFRHDSWVNRTMYDRLRSDRAGYVCVDEPQLPGLLKPDLFCTTKIAYVRLHGRNAKQWWDGGPLRYDYSYSEDEMREWKERIDKLIAKKKADRVYVFFNNCHHGQAAANAIDFEAMFSE